MHYVAGVLIGKNVKIKYGHHETEMDFWTVVLAPSGAGKTWTEVQIADGLKDIDVPIFPGGSASAARFIEELDAKPRALWVRDEYLQLLNQIEIEGGPLSELKDYLLRIYDNRKIERVTKKESFTVESPVLSILGFNALASFVDGITAESLVDGFAQRFSYVIARPDKSRPFGKYPVWNVNKETWSKKFGEMLDGVQETYIASHNAEKRFMEIFEEASGKSKMEESFYRRVMWRAHKYATIYHIMRGEAKNPVISEEDYGWASRLIEMQLSDAADLIDMCSGTSISKAIEAGESVVKKLEEQGLPVTARNIVMRTRAINTVGLARLVLQIIGINETPVKKMK